MRKCISFWVVHPLSREIEGGMGVDLVNLEVGKRDSCTFSVKVNKSQELSLFLILKFNETKMKASNRVNNKLAQLYWA